MAAKCVLNKSKIQAHIEKMAYIYINNNAMQIL